MALPRGVGETRQCPHCKATILASSVVCPGCNGHLRFGPATGAVAGVLTPATVTAFKIEGSFDNAGSTLPREYTVVISIRNQRGEVLEKRVIGVGVLGPNDTRAVTLTVDLQANPKERR
jgi:hypothetical protein